MIALPPKMRLANLLNLRIARDELSPFACAILLASCPSYGPDHANTAKRAA